MYSLESPGYESAGTPEQAAATLLSETWSVCPDCFARIPARRVLIHGTVYLEKKCDLHGFFRTKIWQGKEGFAGWEKPKIPIEKRFQMVPADKGCPFDCGLCPDHRQHTCSAVLEVTSACNLHCTFCFAASGNRRVDPDPSLDTIRILLNKVQQVSPGCNLQISGGEPSLRKDLPEIVALAKETGFEFIQLNTNGLVLAESPDLAEKLKKAGLSSVFLQFDGVSDSTYEALRGRPLFSVKQAAIDVCIAHHIGLVLVPTIVPGVNDQEIGAILEFGLDHAPGVRGVHFQPVSYFGRHGEEPSDADRITIPEILLQIEKQTGGQACQKDFRPPSCEHSLCSFSGKFMIKEDGRLSPITALDAGCCTPVRAEEGARQSKASVSRQWCAPAENALCCSGSPQDGLTRFLERAKTHLFAISGMAFQDAWNLDLERLKGCCIHSVSPDGRLIPFCAYNLTSRQGKGLYRTP